MLKDVNSSFLLKKKKKSKGGEDKKEKIKERTKRLTGVKKIIASDLFALLSVSILPLVFTIFLY